MGAVEIRRGGLHLSGSPLAFDSPRKSELSFVSHAHSDHIARHERVIATTPTVKLMAHRLGKVNAALPVPYNRPFDLGPLNVELLPAGHILGSAQIRVILENGHRVVYTGDINLQKSFTAEPIQLAECDTLVVESTFGHPRFSFPPREEVFAEVEAWLRQNLERGIPPVLLGYPLGKSQEALKYLGDKGYALCAHPAVHAVSQIYSDCGVKLNVRLFDGKFLPDEVGVFPPFGRSQALKRIWPRATAVLTGWALDPGTARRYGADRAFAVSDHADCAALVKYVKDTGASDVITHHGYAKELAEVLRSKGVSARTLGKPLQLDLFDRAA